MLNPAGARAHLAAALRWSADARFDRRRVLVALIASAAPLAAGLWAGLPGLGYALALGSVLAAPDAQESGVGERMPAASALLPPVLAIVAALGLARLPDTDALMILLAASAGCLVNYSRPAAVAGVRFIVLLVLNLGVAGPHGAHGGAALMFGIGALWRVVLARIAQRHAHEATAAPAAARAPTPRQRRMHLRRMLASLQGWQYPLRLAAGLAAACLIRNRWPQHHYDWVVLSTALMTPRALEHLPVHITQRAIGTLAGVALAAAIVSLALPAVAIALLACLFGAAAPLVRSANYAAWCMLSTPLILLAMDTAAPIDRTLLADRLAATLLGAAIVVGANLLVEAALRLAPSRRPGR